ncbi:MULTISPECIES: DUF4304 domain-containing protein [unclassified Flavobacterium]|uniref:DUF4304 domain-containing protein n=1 Tax=unclassified Flavobacterium TaxID=196869 RepID=UPI001F1325BA|nr:MULTISPECIES: DUF4304 domain-containing protein [unclassified Flavobacterium]UMY65294.1 DUF4304 domain-containing protein [Flavobacterium sp. HJ-32-4]
MTAKEKQTQFIKTYLKPALKNFGYRTSGQTWWKEKGDFFTVINLQNFSWNSKDSVDFCFNIGVALKATMNDTEKKKPTVYDLTVYLRENSYLPDSRQEYKFKSKTGYVLTEQTDLNDFVAELKSDFENHILPTLDKLNTLQDCVDRFGNIAFWGDNLKKVITENKLLAL